jgi:hypothetical protein
MQNRLYLAPIVALIVLTTSCSLGKGKELGANAVVQFHNQFNAGQFKEIYDQSDTAFRKAAKETDIVALLEAVRRKLGTIKQSNPIGWRVNATTTETTVSMQYNTEFTEGNATEQFVFLVSGDKAILYNYNINSPLLITR